MRLNIGSYLNSGKLFIVEMGIYNTHKMLLCELVFRFYYFFIRSSFPNLICPSQGV